MPNGHIQIKKHTLQKYEILQKYLKARLKFEKKYQNFAYIDTHGGSGKVIFEGQEINGSPLIGAESEAQPQCFAIEINYDRRMLLRKAVAGIRNITIVEGDCNKEISSILRGIEDWKFTFCFLDPDGLVYMDGTTKVFQLTWATIEEISKRNNSEVLVNLRSQDILRVMGLMEKEPEKSATLDEDITALIGNNTWTSKHTRFQFRDLFLDRLQSVGFTHVGAVNIKSDDNSHQYYLIYGSHNRVGANIMSSNFKFAWGIEPITKLPLERFIYDDPPYSKPTTPQEKQTKLSDSLRGRFEAC